MMQGFEHRLERMVEGVFARAFRSSLRPIELGRRMVREMDEHRTVDVKGRVVVPNQFLFSVSEPDHATFAEFSDALVKELCDAAREYARDEGYTFMGPVQVAMRVDENLKPGRFAVSSKLHESRTGVGALVLGNGERMQLGEQPVRIGRLPECEVSLPDPNVSRFHAEIRPSGTGFLINDLGSTNGTRVNGIPISGPQQLREGDEIVIGTARLRFEAS